MSEVNVIKCKYFRKFYETNPSGYGRTFEDYCFLYNEECDKHPECIFRNNKLQELKKENETLKEVSKSAVENELMFAKKANRAEQKLKDIVILLNSKSDHDWISTTPIAEIIGSDFIEEVLREINTKKGK